MKYIRQCLVNFVDHTNMLCFHLSSLEGNTTPDKKSKKSKQKKRKKGFIFKSLILKKN